MIKHSFSHYYKLVRGCYECRRVAVKRYRNELDSIEEMSKTVAKYYELEEYIFERAKRELE